MDFLLRNILPVLGADHNGIDPDRFPVFVLHGHLGFAIRTQAVIFPPDLCQLAGKSVCIVNGSRHVFIRFTAGKPEHDALVSGTDYIPVDGIVNLRRLFIHYDLDMIRLCIPDFADGIQRDCFIIELCAGIGLSIDQNKIIFDRCFHCHVGLRILGKGRIQNGIGNQIADLVRMTFGNTFTGKNVFRHSSLLYLNRLEKRRPKAVCCFRLPHRNRLDHLNLWVRLVQDHGAGSLPCLLITIDLIKSGTPPKSKLKHPFPAPQYARLHAFLLFP